MKHLGTFPGRNLPRAAAEQPAQGDSLTSVLFAIIVMFTLMAPGFAQVLQ